MHLDPTVIVSAIAGLALVLSSTITGIANYLNGKKASQKLDRIQILVNGRLTEALTELAEAKEALANVFPDTKSLRDDAIAARKISTERKAFEKNLSKLDGWK